MKWSSLGSRDRRALRAGIMLLAPAVVYALAVKPYADALEAARARLSEERELLARESALVREAPSFPDRRRRASTVLGASWTPLVRGADTISIAASLAGYVSGTAESAGLQVEQVESRGADSVRAARLAGGGLVASSVELRGRGDLERVLRFVAALEAGDTYVRIDQLRITKIGGAGDAADQETLGITANVTGIARLLARPATSYAMPPARRSEPTVASIGGSAP